MLPHVIRFNAGAVEHQYLDLLHESNGAALPGIAQGVPGLAAFVSEMLGAAGLATTLRPLGVDPLKLPQLAAHASKQWTATFNPRPVNEEDLFALYQQAFG
jgi:alcohol dehydrogenase